MRLLRVSAIAGTYNYGEPVFGENYSREEAEKTCEEMLALGCISSRLLGLVEQRQSMQLFYKITNAYLHEVNAERNCGLIILECEADEMTKERP